MLINNCLELKISSGFHLEHLQKYIATFRNIFRNVTLPLGSHSEMYVRISIVFPCSVFTADKPVQVFKKFKTLLSSLLLLLLSFYCHFFMVFVILYIVVVFVDFIAAIMVSVFFIHGFVLFFVAFSCDEVTQ